MVVTFSLGMGPIPWVIMSEVQTFDYCLMALLLSNLPVLIILDKILLALMFQIKFNIRPHCFRSSCVFALFDNLIEVLQTMRLLNALLWASFPASFVKTGLIDD